jgi:hypothetical protein
MPLLHHVRLRAFGVFGQSVRQHMSRRYETLMYKMFAFAKNLFAVSWRMAGIKEIG